MLDIELIRKSPEKVAEALKKRNKDDSLLKQFQNADNAWREKTQLVEQLRAEQKKAAAARDKERGTRLKEEVKKIEAELEKLESDRNDLLLEFPNIPFDDVPMGKDESENVVVKTWGNIPKFDFTPKDHLELGERLGIIDTQKAAEVAGARFYYLKGAGAMLEFSLTQFAIETLTKEEFTPVIPPVMARPDIMRAMGKHRFIQDDDAFYIQKDDLYLIGSAEHTLGPLHMQETFSETELPKRYVGFSPSFRREAGSYGRDTRGMFRVHQFDKVEMYSFAHPEKSEEEHRFLLSMQEKLWQALEMPYQITAICTGDMGSTDARQFDINAWIPSQQTYREVGSCSNTTDYQTRGMRIKVKGESSMFAHALNATAIAMSRTIMAILENNQEEDGSIRIPKALRSYVGLRRIEK